MSQPTVKFRFPRFTLFKKMIAAFSIVILFMAGSTFYVYFLFKPVFSSDQPEIKGILLSQDLRRTFEAEYIATNKYFASRDTAYDEKILYLNIRQFKNQSDSLLNITDRREIVAAVQSMRESYQEYDKIIQSSILKFKLDSDFNTIQLLDSTSALRDTIRHRIHSITDSYMPQLNKTLKSFDQRENAKSSGFVVLILSLVVVFAIAFYFALNLLKPIRALKAGTQKVGEGCYETVPITTTDEVADLTTAFNIMSEKLKKLDEMRMELMSEISHEMRTPLQVIKAGCYSIIHAKDGPALTQRQRDAVGMIHQATNRINAFVNSFLDVAKMEAGLMKFNLVETDIVELLTPLVQEAQLIAQTREISLEYTSETGLTLKLDKDRISQVISNLLSNALKYTPNNGSISVRVAKLSELKDQKKNEKGYVQIDVQDSGVGIPEADLAKLFNKFYQAKNTPLVNEKGSGLGLALVKHVAEAHGGKVSVKSQVGVGSTFSVVLPL
jgi:two-component system, NtrC family, sensor histidine kinase GlrK